MTSYRHTYAAITAVFLTAMLACCAAGGFTHDNIAAMLPGSAIIVLLAYGAGWERDEPRQPKE